MYVEALGDCVIADIDLILNTKIEQFKKSYR
jgi:hypothetical protein